MSFCHDGEHFECEQFDNERDDVTEADDSMWWTVENGDPCGQMIKCNNAEGCKECLEFQKWYESGNYVEPEEN